MKRYLGLVAGLGLMSCQPALNRQPKYNALAESSLFPDGAAARPLPQGVVPYVGQAAKRPAAPGPLAELRRGRDRYDIFCSACHGLTGEGGVAAARGFADMPSLLSAHARSLSLTARARIIREGLPRMNSMGGRLPTADIQAIAHYLGALQLSQRAPLPALPAADRRHFSGGSP